MKNARQILWGLAIAIVSIAFIFGGLSLSLAEGGLSALPGAKSPSITPSLSPTLPPTDTSTTSGPALQTSDTPTPPVSTNKLTPTLTSTGCPPPKGWKSYTVQAGDTLEKLAERYQTTSQALQKANCLSSSDQLSTGMKLFIPPAPTPTPVPCGPPRNWVKYVVQPGDTLYHLSQVYGVTVAELQKANCMGTSTALKTGQTLYVPPGAVQPPPSTPTVFTEIPTFPTVPTSLP